MQLGEVLAALLGAVVGAIVGGASTLFASLIVERQKVARETRIRMYDELVPAVIHGYFGYTASRIQQESTPESKEFEQRLGELERASVIAGRKDLALTRDLIDVLIAREFAAHQATTKVDLDTDLLAVEGEDFEYQRAFNIRARRLQAYLADKIR
jgi:hypothetical protein